MRNVTNLGSPFLLAVIQEGAKQAAVEVVQHGDKEELVELKGCWELQSEREDIFTAELIYLLLLF